MNKPKAPHNTEYNWVITQNNAFAEFGLLLNSIEMSGRLQAKDVKNATA